jgi:hypothetical protein
MLLNFIADALPQDTAIVYTNTPYYAVHSVHRSTQYLHEPIRDVVVVERLDRMCSRSVHACVFACLVLCCVWNGVRSALVKINEELLERKSSGSGLEN